jgi:hypothetical protein
MALAGGKRRPSTGRVLLGTPAVPLGYKSARLLRHGRGPMRAVLLCRRVRVR